MYKVLAIRTGITYTETDAGETGPVPESRAKTTMEEKI